MSKFNQFNHVHIHETISNIFGKIAQLKVHFFLFFRFLQQVRAIDKLMLRRRDMLKMLMKPIVDVEGNSLRDSDDNDDDEARTK